jgi:hypothetical protein
MNFNPKPNLSPNPVEGGDNLQESIKMINQQITDLKAQIPSLEAQIASLEKVQKELMAQAYLEAPYQLDWDERISIMKLGKMTPNIQLHNPETQHLNYETIGEPTVLFKSEWVGKRYNEVFIEIISEYSNDYYIPGFECLIYFYENPDKIPQQLVEDNYYFMPGSLMSDKDCDVDVPYGYTNFERSGWLGNQKCVKETWGKYDHILLFRKQLETLKHE